MRLQEFWDSNPRILKIYSSAYFEQQKALDEQFWAIGRYAHVAVYTAVGQLFGKNFKMQYPGQPFSWPKKSDEQLEAEEAERQMREMIQAENAWIINAKMRGLPDNKALAT